MALGKVDVLLVRLLAMKTLDTVLTERVEVTRERLQFVMEKVDSLLTRSVGLQKLLESTMTGTVEHLMVERDVAEVKAEYFETVGKMENLKMMLQEYEDIRRRERIYYGEEVVVCIGE